MAKSKYKFNMESKEWEARNKGTPAKNDVKEGGLLKKWFQGAKSKVQKSMTDDKGVFQGGMKKRIGGRVRDYAEQRFGGTKEFDQQAVKMTRNKLTTDITGDSKSAELDSKFSKTDKREFSEDLREQQSLDKKAGYSMYDRNRDTNPNFYANIQTDEADQDWEVPAYSEEFSYAREFALDFDAGKPKQVLEMQRRLSNAGYMGPDGKPLKQDGILGNNTVNALRLMQNDMIYENKYAKQLLTKQIRQNSEMDSTLAMQQHINDDTKRIAKEKDIANLYNLDNINRDVAAATKTKTSYTDSTYADRTNTNRPKDKNEYPQ